jgi:hypothetical protein
MCNQGVKCIDLGAAKWQILHCVNNRASAVPDSALSTAILKLRVLDLLVGVLIASRNPTKESGAKISAFSKLAPKYYSGISRAKV